MPSPYYIMVQRLALIQVNLQGYLRATYTSQLLRFVDEPGVPAGRDHWSYPGTFSRATGLLGFGGQQTTGGTDPATFCGGGTKGQGDRRVEIYWVDLYAPTLPGQGKLNRAAQFPKIKRLGQEALDRRMLPQVIIDQRTGAEHHLQPGIKSE